jgi:hypothetical protein
LSLVFAADCRMIPPPSQTRVALPTTPANEPEGNALMAIDAAGEGSGEPAIRYGAASARTEVAANDNRRDAASFTCASSVRRAESADPAIDVAGSGSSGAARKLRPTDLFDDLTDGDGTLRAPIPLCATRGRFRSDT